MLCQGCQNRVANVHYTQIVNNKKVELYLCEKCANEKSQNNLGSNFNLDDFFSSFMSSKKAAPYIPSIHQEEACDVCGMTFNDFRNTGKLGCGNCYKLFGDRLKPILRRLHGNADHVGKSPSKLDSESNSENSSENARNTANELRNNPDKAGDNTSKVSDVHRNANYEINKLKELLKKAIQNEEYEKAAELRDSIKNLEGSR